ncbi:PfaD family polyunsaturated fatty acid/polyketide biosynthesis protein [Streptomyces sp. NPDC052396]|uniref:PfaD family polyunsaturated fatty acid/polyketide biosynthesis protein n=1 Tax=Streptomyces sp. NPDC052396 TaxID=3365689 RepID=UPI0037D4E29D
MRAGEPVHHDPEGIYQVLSALESPCYVLRQNNRTGVTQGCPAPGEGTLLAAAGALPPGRLGAAAFLRRHGLRLPYMAGAMAGGIAGTRLVTALSRAGCLAAFGAAGLPAERIDAALGRLRHELGEAPFACNLIHTPMAPRLERACVDLCLRHGVRWVEASAFVQLTPELVRYRLTGLRPDPVTGVRAEHRVIAKVSREETAHLFLRPAPEPLVAELLAQGRITAEQAALAASVPMADALTAEADSGGHTDRRPLAVLVPALVRLRDLARRDQRGGTELHVGAAGGIGSPQAVAAAFALGADYVVTGSVNQAAVEADTSPAVKRLLARSGIADCVMAPAADMFEQGVQVQVLGRGSMFPAHAARLYRLYREYDSLDALPAADRRTLEERVLRRPLAEVWQETAAYLRDHHPGQLARAEREPRHRMALVFRWYLAMTSRWAIAGEPARAADWQIWCGPAMGAFNLWTAGTALAAPEHRPAGEIAGRLLRGAAYRIRLGQLRAAGVRIPAACAEYRLPPADGSTDRGAQPGSAPTVSRIS